MSPLAGVQGKALPKASGHSVGQAASSAGATALLHPCGVLPSGSRVTGPGQVPAAVPIICAVSLCHLSPAWGHSAPWWGDNAGQETVTAGTRGTAPRHRSRSQGLAMAKGKETGEGREAHRRAAQQPPYSPTAATGTFIMEEDLSKLEKNNHRYKKKKKSPSWGNIPQLASPHPPLTAPVQGRDTECLGGEGADCSQGCPRHRPLGTRGQSHSLSLLGSLARVELLSWEAPQQSPSVTDFLWPPAFGTSPPCPREEAAALRREGGPASIPPTLPSTQAAFLQMLPRAARAPQPKVTVLPSRQGGEPSPYPNLY